MLSLLEDQRGAAAFETPIIYGFLIFSLLLPLADLSIAGFQYVSAWQALRAFGQSIQYNPPSDVTNTSSWAASAMSKANAANPQFQISNLKVYCGESTDLCVSANATASVKYFSFNTSVALDPLVLNLVLCPGGNCTLTLPHYERFQ